MVCVHIALKIMTGSCTLVRHFLFCLGESAQTFILLVTTCDEDKICRFTTP